MSEETTKEDKPTSWTRFLRFVFFLWIGLILFGMGTKIVMEPETRIEMLANGLWGGVFGGVFGAIGYGIGYWFKSWRGSLAVLGAMLGFVATEGIQQLVQPAAEFVAERTTKPLFVGIKIDEVLSTNPEVGPFYKIIQVKYPDLYKRIRERLIELELGKMSMASYLQWSQTEIDKLISTRLMDASDDLIVQSARYTHRLIAEFTRLDPVVCGLIWNGGTFGEKYQLVSKELRDENIKFRIAVLNEEPSVQPHPGLPKSTLDQAIAIVWDDVATKTKSDLAIVNDVIAQRQRPKEFCTVVGQFYSSGLSALNPKYTPQFFRQLMRMSDTN